MNNIEEKEALNKEKQSGSVYKCGYCGMPTDKDGDSMSPGYCDSLTEEQLNSAELTQGYCCHEERRWLNEIYNL